MVNERVVLGIKEPEILIRVLATIISAISIFAIVYLYISLDFITFFYAYLWITVVGVMAVSFTAVFVIYLYRYEENGKKNEQKKHKDLFERISTVVDPIFFVAMVLALIVGIMFGIYHLLGWL